MGILDDATGRLEGEASRAAAAAEIRRLHGRSWTEVTNREAHFNAHTGYFSNDVPRLLQLISEMCTRLPVTAGRAAYAFTSESGAVSYHLPPEDHRIDPHYSLSFATRRKMKREHAEAFKTRSRSYSMAPKSRLLTISKSHNDSIDDLYPFVLRLDGVWAPAIESERDWGNWDGLDAVFARYLRDGYGEFSHH